MQESSTKKHKYNYDHNLERQKKSWAVIILSSSFIIFLLTLIGFFDAFSELTADTLLENLGYTNKWSKTYGPDWFVQLNNNISALSGKSSIFIALLIVTGYYGVRKDMRRLWKFLFVVVTGGFLMFILKLIFAEELPYEPIELLLNTISGFPSGHVMMATIFYFTLAVFLTRKQRRTIVRKYTLTITPVLIFLIALSRVLGAKHTPTEVLAGWSAGMVWLCFCWMLERYIKKNRSMI